MAQPIPTAEILAAALGGFGTQKKPIDAPIAMIRQTLRKDNAAARKGMAAAQRKRWATLQYVSDYAF
jgi:hypothetical protein